MRNKRKEAGERCGPLGSCRNFKTVLRVVLICGCIVCGCSKKESDTGDAQVDTAGPDRSNVCEEQMETRAPDWSDVEFVIVYIRDARQPAEYYRLQGSQVEEFKNFFEERTDIGSGGGPDRIRGGFFHPYPFGKDGKQRSTVSFRYQAVKKLGDRNNRGDPNEMRTQIENEAAVKGMVRARGERISETEGKDYVVRGRDSWRYYRYWKKTDGQIVGAVKVKD